MSKEFDLPTFVQVLNDKNLARFKELTVTYGSTTKAINLLFAEMQLAETQEESRKAQKIKDKLKQGAVDEAVKEATKELLKLIELTTENMHSANDLR